MNLSKGFTFKEASVELVINFAGVTFFAIVLLLLVWSTIKDYVLRLLHRR
jgi:hypothetical protein